MYHSILRVLLLEFPSLSCPKLTRTITWISHPSWIPMEKALLSLSAPHRQSQLRPPPSPFPILENPTHMEWVSAMGPQILYIFGTSHHAVHAMADQALLAWQTKQREEGQHPAKVFSFTFDSADPLRDSIPDMLASLFIQAFGDDSNGSLGTEYHILRDQFLFHGGWTEKSCLNILDCLRHVTFGHKAFFLLHDLDECRQDSRALFLN